MGSKLWKVFKREVSLLAIFAYLYQLILLPRTVFFKDTGGVPGVMAGICLLFGGYIIAGLLTKKKQSFLRMLISYLSSIIPALLFTIFYWKGFPFIEKGIVYSLWAQNEYVYVLWRGILEGIGAFLLYFAGVRLKFLDYDSILSRNKLIAAGIIFVSAIIFVEYYNYKELEYLKSTLYAFVYIFIVIVLLVKNQQNLDRAFIKKHIDLATVPGKIRNYNSLIVISIFLLIMFIFNIKALVSFIVRVIKNTPRVIITIMFKILEILSMLFPGSSEGGQSEGGTPQLPMLPEEEKNAILSLIMEIILWLILAAMAVFIIYKLPKVFAFIGRKLKKAGVYILDTIRKLFLINKDYPDHETDYVDEVLNVKPEAPDKDNKNKGNKIHRMGGRLWRNAEPVEKIRFMYGVILSYMKKSGMDIQKSNTAQEVCGKAVEIYDGIPENDGLKESLGITTRVYEKARYGGKAPDIEEYTCFEEKFTQAVDIIKRNS